MSRDFDWCSLEDFHVHESLELHVNLMNKTLGESAVLALPETYKIVQVHYTVLLFLKLWVLLLVDVFLLKTTDILKKNIIILYSVTL